MEGRDGGRIFAVAGRQKKGRLVCTGCACLIVSPIDVRDLKGISLPSLPSYGRIAALWPRL